MLVDVAGDGDVSAGGVAFDADSVFIPASAWLLGREAPNMKAVATG